MCVERVDDKRWRYDGIIDSHKGLTSTSSNLARMSHVGTSHIHFFWVCDAIFLHTHYACSEYLCAQQLFTFLVVFFKRIIIIFSTQMKFIQSASTKCITFGSSDVILRVESGNLGNSQENLIRNNDVMPLRLLCGKCEKFHDVCNGCVGARNSGNISLVRFSNIFSCCHEHGSSVVALALVCFSFSVLFSLFFHFPPQFSSVLLHDISGVRCSSSLS